MKNGMNERRARDIIAWLIAGALAIGLGLLILEL